MKPAIHVENLSKRFRIGASGGADYHTLRETIVDAVKSPFRRLRSGGHSGRPSDFWALNDVSFEVQPGEVVGIIGRNGAGKSTLLKILSRVTEPTKGRVQYCGRIGSLLEVGTGFHQELTGRENIYLNGSILGMSHREIRRKFDEIVAFSEVEQFLDTPVKRYSSGMYVRLAFAVAAHLDPEILIVDEVLAVGDAQFQRKCLGKLGDVAHDGRTVLLVSHQLAAIQRLCRRVVFLEGGRLVCFDDTSHAVNQYLRACGNSYENVGKWVCCRNSARTGNGKARFVRVRCKGSNTSCADIVCDGPLEVEVLVESDAPRSVSSLGITLYDQQGTKLVNADTLSRGRLIALHRGMNVLHVRIKAVHLTPGRYILGLWLANTPEVLDHVREALVLRVSETRSNGEYGTRPPCDGLVTCDFDVQARSVG